MTAARYASRRVIFAIFCTERRDFRLKQNWCGSDYLRDVAAVFDVVYRGYAWRAIKTSFSWAKFSTAKYLREFVKRGYRGMFFGGEQVTDV